MTSKNPSSISHTFISKLAKLAIEIRESLKLILKNENDTNPIYLLYSDFRKNIIPNITENNFADIYAQLLVYTFFVIKISFGLEENFDYKRIYLSLAQINPVFKTLFNFLDSTAKKENLRQQIETIGISKVLTLLDSSEMKEILKKLAFTPYNEDLITFFYEAFLKTYNPEQKIERGVFFTPKPVIFFIIQILDRLLIKKFRILDGVLDITSFEKLEVSKILFLDPAMGAGIFLLSIMEYIKKKFDEHYVSLNSGEREKKWIQYVSNHLLSRIFGFEVLLLPYVFAQLSIDLKMRKLTHFSSNNTRPGIYFTNALEEPENIDTTTTDTINWAYNESLKGKFVKDSLPITIIIGNPPYSGLSANQNAWINGLLQGKIKDSTRESSYFFVDGIPLKEKKTIWLYDDYVKFIRFGQWKIEKTGYGIVAYITNHGYLDNPTFRGMRQQLVQSFSEIYVINLHGNYKKKEHYSHKEKDENIFDIQQGVSINIFTKFRHVTSQTWVYYTDVWGSRQKKFQWLQNNTLETINWKKYIPKPPFYLFTPQNEDLTNEYRTYWKITDVMPRYSSGLITSRDNLTIKYTPKEVEEVIQDFIMYSESDLSAKFKLGNDGRDWKVSSAKADIIHSGGKNSLIIPILYRPFDVRYTYFTGHSRGFHSYPRREIMTQFLELTNYGIITARSNKSDTMDHFFITNIIAEAKCAESTTQSFVFPLLCKDTTDGTIKVNLNKDFILDIEKKLKIAYIKDLHGNLVETAGSFDIIAYIYAMFYSATFRKRYKDLLKIDYPKIPLTSNKELFMKLSILGEKLIKSHLMIETTDIGSTKICFIGEGDYIIQNITSKSYKNEKLYINRTQFFDCIPECVYQFTIGGYKVCEKWLKNRKGTHLYEQDISYYINMIISIEQTLSFIKEIDHCIEKYGGWPIK